MPDRLSFLSPERLSLLLAVVALAVAYVLAQRRRPRYAVRFPELELLRSVVPARRAWLRHLPSALLLLSLTAAVAAFARPTAAVAVPRERATVVVALDVSASMAAQDVSPDRLRAAKDAAVQFVDGLPEGFDVGLVTFAGSAAVQVPPTRDHDAVTSAVRALDLAPGTAIGEAVVSSLAALRSVEVADSEARPPSQVVLLSDGANTVGRPISAGVDEAVEDEVPVTTIAYGTAEGEVVVQGTRIQVPVDVEALEELAQDTGGQAYQAESGDELDAVYDDIGTRVGTTTEQREVTPGFAGVALLAVLGAGAAGLRLSPRIA